MSGQTLNINPSNFTNQGTLNSINGATLTLSGNVTNSGTITVNASTLNLNGVYTGGSVGTVNATNATVNLGGSFTTAGLSGITRSGGTVNLSGTLNNAGSTLSLTPNLGVLTLNSGTITGGTVDNSGGQALFFTNSGSNILNGVQINGGLTIANANGVARLDNGTQISGTVNVSGTNSLLAFNQDGTVVGLTINLGTATTGAFVSVEGNHNLTLDSGTFIHGIGNIGQARLIGGTNNLINLGVITSDVSGQTLTINPNSFTNQGTLNATNGATLTVAGPWTSSGTIQNVGSGTLRFNGTGSSSGTVNVGSGSLVVGGTFTQTAGTFQVAGGSVSSGNALNFQGGLLTGTGSITAAIMNNAMMQPALGGTGLAITGNVTLLSSSQLSFQLGGLTQGSQYGFINVNGTVALGGSLVLSFANGFENSINGSNTFTLMHTSSAFTGFFANVASGGTLHINGFGTFTVTYAGQDLILSNFVAGGPRPGNLAAPDARKAQPPPTQSPSTPNASGSNVGSGGPAGRVVGSAAPPHPRLQNPRLSQIGVPIQNTGQLRALLNAAVTAPGARKVVVTREALLRARAQDQASANQGGTDRRALEARRIAGGENRRIDDRLTGSPPNAGNPAAGGPAAAMAVGADAVRAFSR